MQVHRKTDIVVAKEKHEGLQLISGEFAQDFGLCEPVYEILCDHSIW